jgi:hypothetical protein
MSILLPSKPGFRSGKPRLIDFGVTVTPPMGGPAQRLNRLGNRFGLDITFATAGAAGTGRVLVSRLMQGLTQGVLFYFPQDLDPGDVGYGPCVNGASQTGSHLQLRGFPAEYQVVEGQFFSLVYGGRRYLHAAATDGIAGNDGTLNLPIFPMLRVSPNDGAICEFAGPLIEGFLSGQSLEWQLQQAPYLDVSCTITEAE